MTAVQETDSPRWRRATRRLLLGVLVVRVAYLLVFPGNLVHDEAYYWDWSRQLDWCYYSKPPGVAWLIALATWCGGSTEFFVRLPAALLSTAALALVSLLAARLYGARAGFLAALVSAATPGNAVLGVLMTIDAPFVCSWSAALYFFWRMLERDDDRWKWTALTALAVGCGLLCKQTMLAFPVLAGGFVLLHRPDRQELGRRSFWLGGAGALLFLAPVVAWNSRHDWVTLVHTQEHFTGETAGLGRSLARGGEFLASQLALVSPLTWLLLASLLVALPRIFGALGKEERYLAWFSLPPLLAVTALSFKQRVEGNWPAPFYVAGLILVVGASQRLRLNWGDRALRRAIAVGVVCVLATYGLPFATVAAGLQGSRLDPVARLWGWQDLGRQVGARLAHAPHPERTFLLVDAGRAAASELAFYLPQQPSVYLWDASPAINSQYALWGLPSRVADWDALIVTESESLNAGIASSFREVEPWGRVVTPIGGGRRHDYRLWRGVGFQRWPREVELRQARRVRAGRQTF